MSEDWIDIPDDELPDIAELPEDLRILAEELNGDVGLALRIAQRFAGTPIRTGGVKTLLLRHRDKLIQRAADQGATILSLARRYKRDPRTISKILKKPDGYPARQLKLF